MDNPMLAELDAVVRLSERAAPGKVELHTSCSWRRIVAARGRPFLVPTIDPDRHQNMDTTESAEFVVALVNWFRTHHATLADMAKRLEAAERDAKDAVCVTKAQKIVRDIWETWYPGNEWTPASTTLDLLHQIGNSLLGVPEFERVADSRLRAQNAIDATQEGEG